MTWQGTSVGRHIRVYIQAVVALALATVLLAGLQSSIASAQAANTLKVSPLRTDIEIAPGASDIVKITVTNLTDEPINVRPFENDFVAGDEDGTPALILDEDKFAPSHSLKRFMTPLEDVVIPARESKTVDVVITVPADADAGGYFGALRFAPASPDSGGQVNMSASVASLILLTVPGEVTEKVDLTEFKVQQNGKSKPYFSSTDGIQAFVRLHNKSGIQMGPIGMISVKKGDNVVYETDFNNKTQKDMILPDSARRWEIPLHQIDGFGKYTVSATFTYGQDNYSIEVTDSFWVIPNSILIAAIVGLLVLIGLIVGIVMMLRRKKRGSFKSRNHKGSFRLK